MNSHCEDCGFNCWSITIFNFCRKCRGTLVWHCKECGSCNLGSRGARNHLKNCKYKKSPKNINKTRSLSSQLSKTKKELDSYTSKPLVKKLKQAIEKEKIPKNHITMKFVEDQINILGGFQTLQGHRWSERQLRFWRTVKYLGGAKLIHFFRGNGPNSPGETSVCILPKLIPYNNKHRLFVQVYYL
eukprot:gb/GECH01010196.1/.p1 GENE.gb/GECH01010196.1/~~gb/GECH01010196.1/.p1  ORF type:complete len:186 (+),score=0.17 gb/GECH01010196.1/:1-558(+)